MVKIIDNTQECIDILNNKIGTILDSIGERAIIYAKQNTPVDTGNLRDSITFEVNSTEDKVDIKTDVDYAQYVEEGTMKRPGKHMIRDSLAEHIDEYKETIKSGLNQ